MYLLKTNDLAKAFCAQGGFDQVSDYLEHQCLSDHQIAYNVICTLWIISYHSFAVTGFENYKVRSHILIKFVLVNDHWKGLQGSGLL